MVKKFKHLKDYPLDYVEALARYIKRHIRKINFSEFYCECGDAEYDLLTKAERKLFEALLKHSTRGPDKERDQNATLRTYTQILVKAANTGLDSATHQYAITIAGVACDKFGVTVKQHRALRNWIHGFTISRLKA